MEDQNSDWTKPTNQNQQDNDTQGNDSVPPASINHKYRRTKPNQNSHLKRLFLFGLVFVSLFTFSILAGILAGIISTDKIKQNQEKDAISAEVENQFVLGMADISEGNLEIAKQRFEYIISQDPSYPGAADRMAEILYNLYSTATPTPLLATETPNPTHDPRPAQEMFTQAEEHLGNHEWDATINQLVALRKENPSYETARVDGMLYVALRYRGVEKILKQHNLVGGIYDLALAENFAPLDYDARSARNLARLYIIGSSFWQVSPEQAVYYFGQVASAAPFLRDSSGWTSVDRYRLSLIHYGDQLSAEEKWCLAQEQYEIAYSIRADAGLLRVIEEVALKCSPPTDIVSSPTWTLTPTVTGTLTVYPTLTGTINPTNQIPSSTPSPTHVQPTSTDVPPTPTNSVPTQQPTDTPAPTSTPNPTETDEPPQNPTPTP